MFRDRFWLTLLLTIPTIIWGEMIQHWLGCTRPRVPGSRVDPGGLRHGRVLLRRLALPQGACRELRDRLPGMMTLISLAITVAFVFSLAVTLGVSAAWPLWEELATLVTIMLLGHWIEMRSIIQAQGALQELAKLLPDTAVRLGCGERREEVPVAELQTGDLVLDPARREHSGRRRRARRAEPGQRVDDHRRVAVRWTRRPATKVIAGTVNGRARYASR